MTQCEICGKGPAAVFTPTMAICKPCKRAADRMAIDDFPIPNAPTCATCGSVLNGSGTCGECVVRLVTEAHRDMRLVS